MAEPSRHTSPKRLGIGAKLLASAFTIGLFGTIAGGGTWSAFNEISQNPGNSYTAGTVTITDDDSGAAMFNGLTNVKPADTLTRCIRVNYAGTIPSSVRLYGATGGTGFDRHLDLEVTRGTKTSGFSSCTDFTPDTPTYVSGEGAGVIYRGTLQSFADDYAGGIPEPLASAPESWSSGESHAYRFKLKADSDSDGQSKSVTQSFTWEARNE